jgi:hypothetical protein
MRNVEGFCFDENFKLRIKKTVSATHQ